RRPAMIASTCTASWPMLSENKRLSSSATDPRRKLLSSPNELMLGRWVDGLRGRRELIAMGIADRQRPSGRAAHCQAVDPQGRLADTHRYALALLAAGAHAAVEPHVVADHRHACERVGAV